MAGEGQTRSKTPDPTPIIIPLIKTCSHISNPAVIQQEIDSITHLLLLIYSFQKRARVLRVPHC